MNSRLAPLLLCTAAIVFACGPRPHRQPSSSAAAQKTVESHAPAAMALTPSLDVSVGPTVNLALRVENDSDKRIELTFASGQTHDFVVLDEAGTEVWRWSADRMFTQAMQNKLVPARDTITYSERWEHGGRHGKFTAVAVLNSTNHPLEHRAEFQLP